MKQLTTKSKIFIAIVVLVIIAGAIIVKLEGFQFSVKYSKADAIELYIEKEFDIEDVRQITDEVLGKKVLLQKVEVYEDTVLITSPEITDEQKSQIIEKINDKYGLEISAENIETQKIPHTRLSDIFKKGVLPFTIATGVILLYMIIRFYKLGVLKVIAKTLASIILSEAVLFSIMAITRLPIGIFTISAVLFVYTISLIFITLKLEKDLELKKQQEKEEENKS